MTTFYFDASVPRAVPEALARVRSGDIKWAGARRCPQQSWSDTDWLGFAASEGWTVILRDKRTRFRPAEREALLTAGVAGAFILTGAGNRTRWEVLEMLVTRWRGIEEKLTELDRPFICSVTKARVSVLFPPSHSGFLP